MSLAKKIFLLLALILLTVAMNVEAAEEEYSLPFETLARAYSADENEAVGLIQMKSSGEYAFIAVAKGLDPIGLIPYSHEIYNFYMNKDQSGGYPPVIFAMLLPQSEHGQLDDELGDWDENLHIIPVYALFDVKDGQVICEKPFYSANELKASHYQTKIQNPDHERLIETFLTNLPRLHEVIDSKNISLP